MKEHKFIDFFQFTGGVNGVVFTSARLFATGAQDGNLPSFFSLVHHKQQTPIPSLIFSVCKWIFEKKFSMKKFEEKFFYQHFFLISAHNLIDNAFYIGCIPVDQLFQPNFVVVCCSQYCCFVVVEEDKVISLNTFFNFVFNCIFFHKFQTGFATTDPCELDHSCCIHSIMYDFGIVTKL